MRSEPLPRLTRGGDVRTDWRAINALRDRLAAAERLLATGLSSRRQVFGGGGWRWARPRTYDKDLDYSADQIVVVLPLNTVVVDGHTDPDTSTLVYSQAGLWVCLQSPRLLVTPPATYEIHTPQWPTPTPDDPDDDANYWWPISFYPLCYL